MKSVAFIATSCGRYELLYDTVDSFLRRNTYPIAKYIIVEDGSAPGFSECLRALERRHNVTLQGITKQIQVGQHDSCELAYRSVGDVDFIFHCEDDWLFTRSGFIEDSIRLLESDPKLLTIWLREKYHYIAANYPRNLEVIGSDFESCGIECFKVNYSCGEKSATSGFTFNPSLRRSHDFRDFRFLDYRSELEICKEFSVDGRFSVGLRNFAVVHIGDNRHVVPSLTTRIKKKLRKVFGK